MTEPRRTAHPYGRSADDVRRRTLRRGRTRRLRVAQLVVFAVLALVVVALAARAIEELRTPPAEPGVIAPKTFGSAELSVPCPDPGALPSAPDQVTVRVLNGTARSGLAGSVSEDLAGRGYVPGDTGNTQGASGPAVIVYGPAGHLAAESVRAQVGDAQMRLDAREGTEVDLLLGDGFTGLVDPAAAEAALAAPAEVPEGCA